MPPMDVKLYFLAELEAEKNPACAIWYRRPRAASEEQEDYINL